MPKSLQPLQKAMCQSPIVSSAILLVIVVASLTLVGASSYEMNKWYNGHHFSRNGKVLIMSQFLQGMLGLVLGSLLMYGVVRSCL